MRHPADGKPQAVVVRPTEVKVADMATMSYVDAAVRILESHKRPMTVREIVAEAVQSGLLEPSGKTPKASMSAALYTAVQKGPRTRLIRLHEPGPKRAVRGSVRWALRDQ